MREVPEDEGAERARLLREQGRRDAEALAPRPGRPIYGLAAPSLGPVVARQYQVSHGEWTTITLTYGADDARAGPQVAVTTTALDATTTAEAGSASVRADDLEAELRHAVENQRDLAAGSVGADATAQSPALVLTRETLPAGPALVCRGGSVWAARMLAADPPTDNVVVTIVGLGVDPASVRLEAVADLGPIIEAPFERFAALMERGQGKPRPPLPEPEVELEPAEGVAALLALAEFTLTSNADRRARLQAGQRRRHDPDWGSMGNALWQRAVAEHQWLRGVRPDGRRRCGDGGGQPPGVPAGKGPVVYRRPAAADSGDRRDAPARAARGHRAERARAGRLGKLLVHPRDQAWPRAGANRSARRVSAREVLTDDCLRAWAAWAEIA